MNVPFSRPGPLQHRGPSTNEKMTVKGDCFPHIRQPKRNFIKIILNIRIVQIWNRSEIENTETDFELVGQFELAMPVVIAIFPKRDFVNHALQWNRSYQKKVQFCSSYNLTLAVFSC